MGAPGVRTLLTVSYRGGGGFHDVTEAIYYEPRDGSVRLMRQYGHLNEGQILRFLDNARRQVVESELRETIRGK